MVTSSGLQRLLENPKRWLQGGRVGLLVNPTAVDTDLNHAVDLLHAHPDVDLKILFGPEHGIRGDAQDMISVTDHDDAVTKLPVVSLYGTHEASLTPTREHLEQFDLLLYDIQDVGSRYYTYAATLALAMRAAAQMGVRVVVLDRPNPIGGTQVEGGGIDMGLESFVGLYPIPHRHGMTVGELARLYNTTFDIGCSLEVITCKGWKRNEYYDGTSLPWVMPSPNMPSLGTAIVYPGMCLLEGTNLSEGRGTTRPFELFGAPFIDGPALAAELRQLELPGVVFRPCGFRPTFQKHVGKSCSGLQLHVTSRRDFLPYRTGVAILWAVRKLWPDKLHWRGHVYEFRDDVPAIDLLTGRAAVRAAIDGGEDFERVFEIACEGAEQYQAGRDAALLYD